MPEHLARRPAAEGACDLRQRLRGPRVQESKVQFAQRSRRVSIHRSPKVGAQQPHRRIGMQAKRHCRARGPVPGSAVISLPKLSARRDPCHRGDLHPDLGAPRPALNDLPQLRPKAPSLSVGQLLHRRRPKSGRVCMRLQQHGQPSLSSARRRALSSSSLCAAASSRRRRRCRAVSDSRSTTSRRRPASATAARASASRASHRRSSAR